MATYGNDHISFTVGTGYGLYNGDWIETPAFAFGGMIRLSNRISLTLENLSWNIGVPNRYEDFTSLSMLGGRAMWNRIVLDFGLILAYSDDKFNNVYRFPYLGLMIPLGE